MDWLLISSGADRGSPRPPAPERRRARALRRLLVLLSRAARCELAQLGYSRDGRRGTPADHLRAALRSSRAARSRSRSSKAPCTTTRRCRSQIEKLTERFHLEGGRRGRRPRDDHEGQHRDAQGERRGSPGSPRSRRHRSRSSSRTADLQPSLFDQQNLAEITCEDYPGERLIVCRNPLVGAERARKREDLLRRPSASSRRSGRASGRHASGLRADRARR